jgi:hypothetical protein
MIENLTHFQQITKNRLQIVKRSVNVLELFYEIGYRTKQDVLTQLIIHFPKYNTTSFKKQYTQFWIFRSLDLEIVKDLETVIEKINAL